MICSECGEIYTYEDNDDLCRLCSELWQVEGWEDALRRITPPSNRWVEDLEMDVISPAREK